MGKSRGQRPPSKWKRLRRKIRRAKVKDAIRNSKTVMPKFKRSDIYDWD